MPTFDSLTDAREALINARSTGTHMVQYSDGSRVEYKSDAELAAALLFVDRQLANIQSTEAPRSGRFYFNTSKGL